MQTAWRAPVDGLTAADVVHRKLTALPAATTVGELRAYFGESSSHRLAVLVDGRRFAGALAPHDLPSDLADDAPAVAHARREPVVHATASAAAARDLALTVDSHRLPVVDDGGALVGVVAITHGRDAFCGVESGPVRARASGWGAPR